MLVSLEKWLLLQRFFVKSSSPQLTFWTHNASFIKLAPWWFLYLQAIVPADRSEPWPRYAMLRKRLWSNYRSALLDLIAPLRTILLIRKFTRSTTRHQAAIAATRRRSQRYASLACMALTKSSSRAYSSQEGNKSQQAQGYEIAHSVNNYVGLQGQVNAVFRWSDGTDNGQEQQITPRNRQFQKTLYSLHASDDQVDAEKLIEFIESMRLNERRSIHYSYAISAALKINDIDTALYFHREAVSRLHTCSGSSGILRFVIGRADWDIAIAVWQSTRAADTKDDIWADVKSLPFTFLAKRAILAADFANEDLMNDNVANASLAKDFAKSLLSLCMGMRDVRVNLTHAQSVFQKSIEVCGNDEQYSVCCEYLTQLLSAQQVGHDQAALRVCIEIFDAHPSLDPGNHLWTHLFETGIRLVSGPAILRLIHCWRVKHGKVRLEEYSAALTAFADAGEIIPFMEVFAAYRDDYPIDSSVHISQTTLRIHQRRCNPEAVVRAFENLSDFRGLELNAGHYNTVISTFARAGDVEAANSWFLKLQNSKLRMNQASYTALMAIHAERGDCAGVSVLYDDALSRQILPDEQMFGMLVHAYVKEERLEEAQHMLENVPRNFTTAFLTEIWNRLLFGYAYRLDLIALKHVHMRMQELNVPSDETTYAALVTGLSLCKFPQNAQKMVRKVMPRLGLVPGPIHHAAVMEGYIRTREYRRVFVNYHHLLSTGQQPDMNIKNLVLTAGAGIDYADDTEPIDGVEHFPLARRLFDEIVSSLEPVELASIDSFKYVGVERLDEAWISGYFEKMMMHYASVKAYSHVSELFDSYLQTAQSLSAKDLISSPPLKILSALLVCHGKSKNHEGVQRCWNMAVVKSDIMSRPHALQKDGNAQQIPTSRQLILNHPLKYYLIYLGNNRRYQQMEQTINELSGNGFELTHANLNLYIQYLCRSPDQKHKVLALRLSEMYLMDEWWGWDSMKFPYIGKYFKAMERRIRGTRIRAPKYRTLVALAKAYVDLGIGKPNHRKSEAVMTLQAGGEALRTLNTIENMPRLDDQVQRKILG